MDLCFEDDSVTPGLSLIQMSTFGQICKHSPCKSKQQLKKSQHLGAHEQPMEGLMKNWQKTQPCDFPGAMAENKTCQWVGKPIQVTKHLRQ
jgi:hypothetical protein